MKFMIKVNGHEMFPDFVPFSNVCCKVEKTEIVNFSLINDDGKTFLSMGKQMMFLFPNSKLTFELQE